MIMTPEEVQHAWHAIREHEPTGIFSWERAAAATETEVKYEVHRHQWSEQDVFNPHSSKWLFLIGPGCDNHQAATCVSFVVHNVHS